MKACPSWPCRDVPGDPLAHVVSPGGQKACFRPRREGVPETLMPHGGSPYSIVRSGRAAPDAHQHGHGPPPGISRGVFHVHAQAPDPRRPVFETLLEPTKAARLLC